MNSISRLFQPTSVAVIGASDDPEKLTSRPITYLQKHGFQGSIYPVNPRYETVAGLTCYADVASLPSVPDVAIVLVGANRVIDVVRQLAEAGTGASIVLASGFGEAGAEGEVGAGFRGGLGQHVDHPGCPRSAGVARPVHGNPVGGVRVVVAVDHVEVGLVRGATSASGK